MPALRLGALTFLRQGIAPYSPVWPTNAEAITGATEQPAAIMASPNGSHGDKASAVLVPARFARL